MVTQTLQKDFGTRIKENIPLSPLTTFKIGGPADLFLEVTSADELIRAVRAARSDGVHFFLLGGGSNILVADAGFRGLVIRNSARKIAMKAMRGGIGPSAAEQIVYVEAESGVGMNQLVRYVADEGLSGIEMHLGLPGTVGGAVSMNSKWGKPLVSIGEAVFQVAVLTEENVVKNIPNEAMEFSYGQSRIKRSGEIILSVIFALKRQEKTIVWKKANESIEYRRISQPQGVKSAGCAFKNLTPAEALTYSTPNSTVSSGFLIDHSGCKGLHVGGAHVSPLHANFIVNDGTATASDVIKLIDLIRQKVFSQFNVTLRDEIIRIGDF